MRKVPSESEISTQHWIRKGNARIAEKEESYMARQFVISVILVSQSQMSRISAQGKIGR
ncbi:MAG: hypothetical protein ACRD8Z_06600 [Nitrososphaeraceae archaeon]